MITLKNLKEIFGIFISDESFCRLIAYGDDPFAEGLEDITSRADVSSFMRGMIRFSLQVDDLQDREEVRVLMYKNYTRLSGIKSVVRNNSLKIDLFVPHRLVQEHLRIYELEEKISNLLDGKRITGIGTIDYTSGRFTLSPVNGYSLFEMTFETRESRNIVNGRL